MIVVHPNFKFLRIEVNTDEEREKKSEPGFIGLRDLYDFPYEVQ